MIDIILADDQFEVREALKCLLECQPDIHLASEAMSADELLMQLSLVCPDIVLFDWELPESTGGALVSHMRALCPSVRLVAWSSRPEACREALQAGAHGFVSKGDPPERLLYAIRHCDSAHV
jgi:DNA-binding NarL/FixJ family response regulator